VVGYYIDHDLNSSLVESIHHDIKVGKGTDLRVYISVVGNIIYSELSSTGTRGIDSQPPSLRAEG